MNDSLKQYSGISELLEQDLSSYEYFHSLPAEFQRKIEEKDINEFNEMQSYAKYLFNKQSNDI